MPNHFLAKSYIGRLVETRISGNQNNTYNL